MQETREQQVIYRFFQGLVLFSLIAEFSIFIYYNAPFFNKVHVIIERISNIPFYDNLVYSKLCTLFLICCVSIGTVAKKDLKMDAKRKIFLPLFFGLLFFFGSLFFYGRASDYVAPLYTEAYNIVYMLLSIVGATTMHVALDNISKLIKTGLGKDKWNVEAESFLQPQKIKTNDYSVNIPMQFYYHGRVHDGWLNIDNPFRGTMVIGTPGSGKTFSIIEPFIRQLLAKEFTMCLYDYKHPDLGKIAYYHYQLNKQEGRLQNYGFHVINIDNVEKSRRINPLRADYITSQADASETAAGLINALQKGSKQDGSSQFFTESAVNFLASCIYFLSIYEDGKYSSLPHLLSFINREYEEIFTMLFSEPELHSLLTPFMSVFKAKEWGQLEGQVGTLRIYISRLATKETYWVFSGNDFNLKISDQNEPSIMVMANSTNTEEVNSACYSVILNRMNRLINTKHNKPSAIIADEVPTIFMHKIEGLIATARSNKVAVVLGLQELPQFRKQYGKDTADTITSVIGNILAGSLRNKETIDWLERLFGKTRQLNESITIDRERTSKQLSERLDALIPAGKIASLKSGQIVGILASEAEEKFDPVYTTSAVNCKVNLDLNALKKEAQYYTDLPTYYQFADKRKSLLENFKKINMDIERMVLRFKNVYS